MMKPYFKRLGVRLTIFFCLLFMAFIIHSCHKTIIVPESDTATDPNILAAQAWYNSTHNALSATRNLSVITATGNTTAAAKSGSAKTNSAKAASKDWNKMFSPNWKQAAAFTKSALNIVETQAIKQGNVAFSTDPTSRADKFNFATSGNLTSLLIIKVNGQYGEYAMTIVADSSYLKGDYSKLNNNTYRHRDNDFTGMVLYHKMDGTFVNGWKYVNGVVTAPLYKTTVPPNTTIATTTSAIVLSAHGARALKVSVDCETILISELWEDCYYYTDDYDQQYPIDCEDYSVPLYYYTTCSTTDDGSGGGGGTPADPCASSSSLRLSTNLALNLSGQRQLKVDTAINGNDPDGGIIIPTDHGQSGCAVANNTDTTKKDPCAQRAMLSGIVTNPIVANQNAQILANSNTYEYGTNNNLTAWQGSNAGTTFVNTPVTSSGTTSGNTSTWAPTFTWDSTNGFTIGFTHAHPAGNAPSYIDVFNVLYPTTSRTLTNAGPDALQYYQNNAFVNTLTSNGSYMITVSDWTTLTNTYLNSYSTSTQQSDFDTDYRAAAQSYINSNPLATNADAGVYALMTLFGSAINIYHADTNSTTYTPLILSTGPNGQSTVSTLPCPN